jgi:hypothetical protein
VSFFEKLKKLLGGKQTAPASNDPQPSGKGSEPGEPPRPRAPQRRTKPQEDARLEAEARELFDAGDPAGAVALLAKLILFSAHQSEGLPCLCRDCLRPELREVDVAGERYVRDFVVAKHRVLFYWAPAELARSVKQLRASMRAALRERVRALAHEEHLRREGINPFSKEPIVIPPKEQRTPPLVNPLTGKRLP